MTLALVNHGKGAFFERFSFFGTRRFSVLIQLSCDESGIGVGHITANIWIYVHMYVVIKGED